MRVNMRVRSEFKTKETRAKVRKAAGDALNDVTVKIANQAKTPWPTGTPYLTGNNSRSIYWDVDKSALTAMVYSTSGYGGFLEVGTVRMGPRPYMKPALDRYLPELLNVLKDKLKW